MRKRWAATVGALIGLMGLMGAEGPPNFGDPLATATPDERAAFAAGKAAFENPEEVDEGLGPVFNEQSCVTCHLGPNGATGGNTERVETRFGRMTGQSFDPMSQFGGSLIQDHGIGREGIPNTGRCRSVSFDPEVVPQPAKIIAGRRTTPLFGLGLVDATLDQTFRDLAADQARVTPSTAGVVSVVGAIEPGQQNFVGRFGWKAQNPTLHVFAGDAYLNEMGVTNPTFPDENCPQGKCNILACNPRPDLNDDGADVDAFTNFMTFLAPPPRGSLAPGDRDGENVFARIGCAACHTPTLTTGANASPALAQQVYHPYSDFLLHDMATLGDGITQGTATGRLMRTAPLWGLRTQTTLLHDGRARTVTDAITAHDGQGAAARTAFGALNAEDRRALLAFLASL